MKTNKLMMIALFLILNWPLFSMADGIVSQDETKTTTESEFTCTMLKMPYPALAYIEKVEGFVLVSLVSDENGNCVIKDIAGSDPLLIGGVKDYLQKTGLKMCAKGEKVLKFNFVID